MKKAIIIKRLTAMLLAASIMVSVVSCSSENDNEEEEETATTTTEETTTAEETTATEETTTAESTAEETTEETTVETTAETTSETTFAIIDDPEVNVYTDDEVKMWASWYISNGYDIEYMDFEAGESWWGEGTNMVEGFAAAEGGDNLFTLDYVMKFPDHETADAFLNELDGSDFGTLTRSENGDGSCSFEVEGGMWYGSLSTNNVIVFVCNEDFEG